MYRTQIATLLWILSFTALVRAAEVTEAESSFAASAVIPFIDRHCIECHDDVSTKGDLNLLELEFDPTDPHNLETWIKVYDRVADGEMPPEKKPRPSEEDASSFLRKIAAPVTAVYTELQEREGRVVFRRLNRTEYEYTLRDLLSLPYLSVREMLPGDSESHGFDTVGEALNLSYVQMTKFLETADLALTQAIEQELVRSLNVTFEPEAIRKTGAEIGRFKVKNGEVQHLGDTRILLRQPNSAQTPWRLGPLEPSGDGNYRIRISCYGVYWDDGTIKAADRPHAISLFADANNLRRHLHSFDVPNDKAGTFEATVRLNAGESIMIHFDSLDDRNGPIRNKKQGIPYQGPGIACEWFELEGPLPESAPTDHQNSLFEGVTIQQWTADSGLPEPRAITVPGVKPRKNAPPVQPMVVSDNPEQDATRLLQKFMTRAFRRPVGEGEVDIYLPLVLKKLEKEHPFQDAMLTGFKAVLCSPDFLFFKESPGRLDDYALASRLSYFLWKSMPDAALLELAEKGELSKPEVLRAETERLLNDGRSQRMVEEFLDQWLDLRRIAFTEPDKELYPEFTPFLQDSMVNETRAFFAEMLREDLEADHLVDSDFAFVNGSLAQLYELPNVEGVALRRVDLPDDSPRGGFLTQGSVLKVTANGTTTSPVTRGVWIMERILGKEPPPPPPGVGSIDPDVRGTTTIREQLAKHSSSESCAGCHRSIDPPGFALESFDVMGGWRDRYRALGNGDRADKTVFDEPVKYKLGPHVDASGKTADGKPFQNIEEFRQILLEDSDQLARNLTERFLTYSTGAGVGFADRPEVEHILSQTEAMNHGARSLVHAVVQSSIFQSK